MSAAPNPLSLAPQLPRIRVLVVDDSVVMRSLLSKFIGEEPAFELVGTARNGQDALGKVPRFTPDVITLDIEMPVLDGLSTLRILQRDYPAVKVILCSGLTEHGAKNTVDALMAGASEYVAKRSDSDKELAAFGQELQQKILGLYGKPQPAASHGIAPVVVRKPLAPRAARPRILAIGVSTGGPDALARVIPKLPRDFPLPVVIVQHMPAVFTQILAGRLAELSAVPVCEAAHGMSLQPGNVYLAPGDFHMVVVEQHGEMVLHLNQEERENFCRPAVDVLFRSVARVYGGESIAVILTGMGRDGLNGVREMKQKGSPILAQDAATSVVWGMPGAVVQANLADSVLPLDNVVSEVLRLL